MCERHPPGGAHRGEDRIARPERRAGSAAAQRADLPDRFVRRLVDAHLNDLRRFLRFLHSNRSDRFQEHHRRGCFVGLRAVEGEVARPVVEVVRVDERLMNRAAVVQEMGGRVAGFRIEADLAAALAA